MNGPSYDEPRRSRKRTKFETPNDPSLARPVTWRAALVSLATVAALLVFGFFFFRTPTSTAWGWNEQQIFAGSPTADEYLARLADAGATWSRQRPETKDAVSQRIREMGVGCRRLIDADHRPLSADEQAALKQLCRTWLGEFIDVEFDLRRDRITPREARDAMDRIVDKLVEGLRSLRADVKDAAARRKTARRASQEERRPPRRSSF